MIIVIVGISLRSYQLTARSIWFDETFSWRLIKFTFSDMISRAAADVHPPLYYLVLKSWSYIFGTSLLTLRAFSVTCAAGTIAVAYLFASYGWRSRMVGLLAATLVAVSGWQIAFAWEARMYTLGTGLALLSSWLLLVAVRNSSKTNSLPRRLSWWALYASITAGFAYVHYYALFTIAGQSVWLIGYCIVATRGRILEVVQLPITRYALFAAGIAIALYIPWIPVFLSQTAQVQASYWIPPLGGWSLPDTFYRMFIPTAAIPPHTGLGIISTLIPIVMTGIIWVAVAIKTKPHDSAWLTVLLGVVPFLLSSGISLKSQSLYQDRFFVFAHLFILISIAALIMRLRRQWARITVTALLVVSFLAAYHGFWRELRILEKPGVHAATQAAMAQRKADESLLVNSSFIFFAVDHYIQEEFAGAVKPYLFSESRDLIHFAGGPILKSDDVVSREFLDATTNDTVLVIDTSGFGASDARLPSEWQRIERRAFPEVFSYQGEVVVSRYERR